jgi:hypothetical protein
VDVAPKPVEEKRKKREKICSINSTVAVLNNFRFVLRMASVVDKKKLLDLHDNNAYCNLMIKEKLVAYYIAAEKPRAAVGIYGRRHRTQLLKF